MGGTLSTTLTGTNNDLVFTAVDTGPDGSDVSVEFIDPGTDNAALSVAVVNDPDVNDGAGGNTAIQVHLATGAAAAAAAGVLTSDNTNPDDGETVTIGATVYTFKTNLSVGPAVPYEVKIGADADTTLGNLIAAITAAAGAGTKYGTGTVAHPTATATTGAGHTMNAAAKTAGVAGNAIATTEASAHLSWGHVTLQGGTDRVGPNSTAAQVKAAIDGAAPAAALVTVANKNTDNGTGAVTAMAQAYLRDLETRAAGDVGVPMLAGDSSEPQGPEDALGPGPHRGDYTDRLGYPEGSGPHTGTTAQASNADDIGDTDGAKGGVTTT